MNPDQTHLANAIREAVLSPDPSTQNGALLVSASGRVIARGCNRFPAGVAYTTARWERPAKYQFIEHAERVVVYATARLGEPADGATLYCPWFACADCARAIIEAGIVRCVGLPMPLDQTHQRWAASCDAGDDMLREAGVEIVRVPLARELGLTVRRNGVGVAI